MSGHDVVVLGATSAGVAAAVEAARGGRSVLLVEAGSHVGGMTSGGLGYTDVGDERALGGPAARFRQDVADAYGTSVGRWAGPEPRVAEEILLRWIEEAGVELRRRRLLVTVTMDGARIGALQLVQTPPGQPAGAQAPQGAEATETVTAAVFLDATYEGDLLAAAGVSFRVGREDRTLHGEEFAGRREFAPGRHNLPPVLSPFRDDPSGATPGPLLPGIHDRELAPVGAGDHGVMAYGLRVCLTRAEDRLPVEPTSGYDPERFELARRLLHWWEEHGIHREAGWMIGLEPNLPGQKCDGNSLGPFSLNVLDGSTWEYPTGSAEVRSRIRQAHVDHTRDLLHFLATDPAVPTRLRRGIRPWGLPREEFADSGHLPHQLYVREARRMVSEHVLTETSLRTGEIPADSITLGSYHLDIREVQRTWSWAWEHPDRYAYAWTEGYLSVPVPVYGIPYRALVPRREECENLLVPVCLSASHVAFSSIRMEPQYMMLGASAGAAARQAVDGLAVQDVDVSRLRAELAAVGQRVGG